MVKIFLLYAILIFAKKAPKLIADLLKLKSEGIGLKGLNIKNKLGEAALVGDKVKKGLTTAEGAIRGSARGALSGGMTQLKMGAAKGFKDKFKEGQKNGKGFGKSTLDGLKGGLKDGFNKQNLKLAGQNAKKGGISGGFGGAKAAGNIKDGNLRGIGKNAAKEVAQVVRGGELSFADKLKLQISGKLEQLASHGISSLEIARSNEAKAMRDKYNRLIGSSQTEKVTEVINKLTGADKFDDDAVHQAYIKTQKSIADTTDGSYTAYRSRRDGNGKAVVDANGQFVFDKIEVNKEGHITGYGVLDVETQKEIRNLGQVRTENGIEYVQSADATIKFTDDNGSDKLLLKKNIYEAREKALSEMQQKYSELLQVGGLTSEQIRAEVGEIFANTGDLFKAHAGNSSDLELNIGSVTFEDIAPKDSHTLEIYKVSALNSKAKSANDSEISKRDEIEHRKAAGQATTNDGKK